MKESRVDANYRRDFEELQSYRRFRDDAAKLLTDKLNSRGWSQAYNDHNWCHDDYPNGFFGADYSGVDTLVCMALYILDKNHPNHFNQEMTPRDLMGTLGKIQGIERKVGK